METILIVVSLVVAGAAFVVAWRRPENLKNGYDARVNELRTTYEKAVEELRDEIELLKQESDKLRFSYWEALGDAAWLKRVLQLNSIEIPPTPDNYKPKIDRYGNISIMVTGQGGTQITGGRVDVGRNLTGGNLTEEKK